MANLTDMARPAVEDLLQADESQLYEELAIRVKGMQSDPGKAGSFAPDVTYDAADMGALDDLRAFGTAFFKRLNVSAFNLICGVEAEDAEERQTVLDSFGLGKEAVAAAIAGLLVAQLGLAPAVAAVVAALVIKHVFRNAHEAMCEVWKEKLPQEGS
jgi:hypothetical protein